MFDYKSIIKSRDLRLKILQCFNWVPDKQMVQFQYLMKLGRLPKLNDPQRFSEKTQWYKLNYRDPVMPKCVDKYEVREYVRSKGCGSLLNDCYGVYDTVEEIDFDKLPDRFVLKNTLGGAEIT